MYEHAVVMTKAYPLHRGHEHLINQARKLSRRVTVCVVWDVGQQPEGRVRAQWVRDTFPDTDVKLICDLHLDDNNPEDSKLWAMYTLDILEGDEPDVVFTSEPYGEWWANAMGVKHVQVDTRRTLIPISGTDIRSDPYANWQYINKFARLHYLKRVLVVGPESVGKTTLCQTLSKLYGTLYVPEYGRIYVEQLGPDGTAITEEHKRIAFANIVNKQPELEDTIEKDARLVCFYDTDLFTTALWYKRWEPDNGEDKMYRAIMHKAHERVGRYDLVLLCHPEGVPFVDDGYREMSEDERKQFRTDLWGFFNDYSGGVAVLKGSWEEREADAIDAINDLFWTSNVTLPSKSLLTV